MFLLSFISPGEANRQTEPTAISLGTRTFCDCSLDLSAALRKRFCIRFRARSDYKNNFHLNIVFDNNLHRLPILKVSLKESANFRAKFHRNLVDAVTDLRIHGNARKILDHTMNGLVVSEQSIGINLRPIFAIFRETSENRLKTLIEFFNLHKNYGIVLGIAAASSHLPLHMRTVGQAVYKINAVLLAELVEQFIDELRSIVTLNFRWFATQKWPIL